MAQAWPGPLSRALNVVPPDTGTGKLDGRVEPLPSVPWAFAPQQYAFPAVVRPHVYEKPAETALSWRAPATCTGEAALAVPPLPSAPPWFSPQHQALPSCATAQ